MAIIGSGQFTYEIVENWARLPAGWSFGTVTGVAVDFQDRLYVCQQQQTPPILVFDQKGNYLTSWGTDTIVEPHTLIVGQDNLIYLADRGAHVALKLTLDGEPLLELGTRGHPSDTGCATDSGEVLRASGPFNRPTRMIPSPSGEVYVSDGYRNSRVHRFSADGMLLNSWGIPGKSAPGEFRVPHSVGVDRQGVIYVCDRGNNRIQIFSGTGDFISQWANVDHPTDIYIDADETVYVCERHETSGNWISVRDKSGDTVERWKSPRVHQIWVDSRGDIYGAEALSRSVTKLVRRR